MKGSKLFACLGLSSLLFLACEKDQENSPIPTDMTTMDQLKSLGFNTNGVYQATMDGKEGHVVEGDIFLDQEMIDYMLESNAGTQFKHYVAPDLLPRDRAVTVDVYLDTAFGRVMEAAFLEALRRYNAVGTNLTFRRAFSRATSDIAILSENIPSPPGGGTILGRSAGFPRNGRPATPIVLNSQIYGGESVGADAVTVVAHEIGHAIGFRHTDWDDRSYSCGGNFNNEGRFGALYIPGTPAGPEAGSWMLACSNGSDRPFTTGDINALRFVY